VCSRIVPTHPELTGLLRHHLAQFESTPRWPSVQRSARRRAAGVYRTQVAEWAGHSVDVLLRICAMSVVGQNDLAKRRISEALRPN